MSRKASDYEILLPFFYEGGNTHQDMLYSQSLAKLGLVNGVGRVMTSKPRMLPNGGHYHTDGLRAVFVFEEHTIGLSDIQFFEWERLIDHHRKQIDTTSTP